MGDRMLKLGTRITTVRQAARHRRDCYRWDANGRCLDCGRFTGFPGDVVEGVAAGAIVYYRPGSVRKPRMAHVAALPALPSAEPAERAPRTTRKQTRGRLTADQVATQRAWRE